MSQPKRICPICNTRTDSEKCPNDAYPTFEPPEDKPKSETLSAGDTFDGKYQVEGLIGKGGMGTVYKAVQLSMKRTVALKVLNPELSSDMKQVKRFHREAMAASMLEHPNTIRIFDFGYAKDRSLFIAMEYLKGQPISSAIKSGKLTVSRICRISIQILKSLAEAHKIGIIHRDLKPENIFLTEIYGEKDFVKVLDFGIARLVWSHSLTTKLTETGAVIGTPTCMSPEQCQGKEIDHRTDIYSFGILLFEMLTGHVPFDSEEPLQIMYKHVHEPVPEIERAVSNEIIPDELIKFLHKCLEKDPLKRISSVDAAIPVLEWIIARENLPKIQSEIETQPEKIEVKPKIPEARRPVTLSEIDTVLTPKYEDKIEEKYAETPLEAVSRRSFIKFSPYHYVFGSMVLFILIAGVYFYLKDTDNIKTEGGALPVGDAGIYAIDLTDVYEIENTDLLTQAPDSIEITSADQALGLFQDSIPDGVPENKFRTSLKTSAALKTENVFSKSAHIPEKKPAEHKTTLIKDQKTKPRIIDRKEPKKEDFGEEW